MSTSRRRRVLKLFAIFSVMTFLVSSVYLINDSEESEGASYSYGASDFNQSEYTFYVGDSLAVTAWSHSTKYVSYGRFVSLHDYENSHNLPSIPGISVTSKSGYNMTLWDLSGTFTTAGDYSLYWVEIVYYKEDGEAEITQNDITLHILPVYSVSFSSGNTNYGTVNKSSVSVPSGTSLIKSNNTVTVNGTTCTASAKSATAQYTFAFSKWQYSTNNGSSWSNLGNSLTINSDTLIRAVFTATTNSYQVEYYNGSSQITSYTETVQYGSHITHASYSVSGKVFCGWYKSSSSFTSANLVTTSTAVTGALTLYAYMVDVLAFTTSPVANATIMYASDLGSVLFDALKSESAYRVLWDFGDGTYGDEVVMYHHYEEPGTYNVFLSVYNYNGELDTKEYVVAVYDMENPPEKSDITLLVVGCTAALILASFAIIRPF